MAMKQKEAEGAKEIFAMDLQNRGYTPQQIKLFFDFLEQKKADWNAKIPKELEGVENDITAYLQAWNTVDRGSEKLSDISAKDAEGISEMAEPFLLPPSRVRTALSKKGKEGVKKKAETEFWKGHKAILWAVPKREVKGELKTGLSKEDIQKMIANLTKVAKGTAVTPLESTKNQQKAYMDELRRMGYTKEQAEEVLDVINSTAGQFFLYRVNGMSQDQRETSMITARLVERGYS